jgi:hypothetical protein
MIVEKIAPAISIYKDVFNASHFIDSLEKECEDDWSTLQWTNSGTGGGSINSFRTSVSVGLGTLFPPFEKTDLSSIFQDTVRTPIEKVVKDYIDDYFIPNGISEEWQVLKYYEGAEYKGHYDHGPNAPRIFSMVAILKAPESGGNLEFPNFTNTVAIEDGMVILFPSNFPYLHIAHPVKSGVKYSLVTWFR